jgi:hypothetical protein
LGKHCAAGWQNAGWLPRARRLLVPRCGWKRATGSAFFLLYRLLLE